MQYCGVCGYIVETQLGGRCDVDSFLVYHDEFLRFRTVEETTKEVAEETKPEETPKEAEAEAEKTEESKEVEEEEKKEDEAEKVENGDAVTETNGKTEEEQGGKQSVWPKGCGLIVFCIIKEIKFCYFICNVVFDLIAFVTVH